MHSSSATGSTATYQDYEEALLAANNLLEFDRYTNRLDAETEQLIRETPEAKLRSARLALRDVLAVIDDKSFFPPQTTQFLIAKLAKQLGIYYLIYARDRSQAEQYLETFKNYAAKDSMDYAEALTMIAHAGTIAPNYHAETGLLAAKLILDNIHRPANILQLDINKGYNLCFLGLVYYRKSYLINDNTPEQRIAYLEQALAYNAAGQELQQHVLKEIKDKNIKAGVTIELANSFHINGIILDELKRHAEALEAYAEAERLEKLYMAETGKPHPMLYITMQNQARSYIKYLTPRDPEKGLEILETALAGQIALYGDIDHADIHKTHAFFGDGYIANEEYAKAVISCKKSIVMKRVLKMPETAFAMRETKGVMLQALQNIPRLDWNDFHTIKPFGDVVPLLVDTLTPEYLDGLVLADLAPLFYKLGAYFNHVPKPPKPDEADTYLGKAQIICAEFSEKYQDSLLEHEIYNHLLFSALQRLPKNLADKTPAEQAIIFADFKAKFSAAGKPSLIGLGTQEQGKVKSFEKLILAYGMGDYHRTLKSTDKEAALKLLAEAIDLIQEAIALWKDTDEQNLRATNRLADFVNDYKKLGGEKFEHINPLVIFEHIERERKRLGTDEANPWAARFYFSFSNYLETIDIHRAIEKREIAYKILCESATDGLEGEFTLFVKGKLDALRTKAELDTGSSVSSSASVMTFGAKPVLPDTSTSTSSLHIRPNP